MPMNVLNLKIKTTENQPDQCRSLVYSFSLPKTTNVICRTCEQMRNTYKILPGKREGKRPLGGNMSKWEHNIIVDVKKI